MHVHAHDERPYASARSAAARSSRALLKATEPERLVCMRCGFVFYLDPKVAVGTIIRDDRRPHRAGPARDRAGLRQVGVSRAATSTAARRCTSRRVREAREEAGLDVRLDRLINIYSYPGRAPVIIVYAATMIGGCLACDDEGLEAQVLRAGRDPVGRAGVPQHARSAARVSGDADLKVGRDRRP